jgi:DNA-binding NarL/FixJ family response regulator
MLADENISTLKDMAFKSNISYGTIKVAFTRIYHKLKLDGGSQRSLLLWAFKNQEKLGIEIPFNAK